MQGNADETKGGQRRSHKFFKAVADDEITQADRNIVEMKQDQNYEDAFFLLPATEQEIHDILFVHTASNSLKKHIPYISRSDLGLTKEMGMKMINIMTDMIHFIKGESEDQSSQQSNQVFAHNSQEHQHIKQERIAGR